MDRQSLRIGDPLEDVCRHCTCCSATVQLGREGESLNGDVEEDLVVDLVSVDCLNCLSSLGVLADDD